MASGTNYEDLLKDLESGKLTVATKDDKKLGKPYMLDPGTSVSRKTYTKQDIEGLLGVVVSLIVSWLLNKDTKTAVAVSKANLLAERFEHYKQLAEGQGQIITDGATELSRAFETMVKAGIQEVIEDPETNIRLATPIELRAFVALATALFTMGRNYERIPEADRPAPKNVLTGVTLSQYPVDPHDDDPEVEGSIAAMVHKAYGQALEAVDDLEITAMLTDPSGWIREQEKKRSS